MKGGESVPPWVELLLSTQFFTTCSSHLISPRNECNFFCIDCQTPQAAFCYYCRLTHHSSHHVIQIRRSSYHDVVKVSELEDILDISYVQTYVINSSRVVYLTERPQLRSCGVSNIKLSSSQTYKCEICSRTLLDDFRFCSLGCNFTAIKSDNETNVAQNGIASNGKDVEIGSNDGNTNAGSANEISSDANNYRNEIPSSTRVIRHRRKGIPRRAPFF